MGTDITSSHAGFPFAGENKVSVLQQRITATTAKPWVSGTTYHVFNIPINTLALTAWYEIVTLDAGGATVTVNFASTAASITAITTGATSGAAGTAVIPANTSTVHKWYEVAGTVDIVIGGANATTAVIDLFVAVVNSAVQSTETIYVS